jgi:hypothetical protein
VLKRGTILRVGCGGGRLAFTVLRLWFFWGVGWGRLVTFKLQRVENHWVDVWQLKARITFIIVIDSYIK